VKRQLEVLKLFVESNNVIETRRRNHHPKASRIDEKKDGHDLAIIEYNGRGNSGSGGSKSSGMITPKVALAATQV
jgi:hypothetical protein